MAALSLSPRAHPQQERARQTIERLLNIAARLLVEVGVDAFNTNLLAQTAGVSPRAIYRYFPNKWALLLALSQRYAELEQSWIGDLASLADSADWREMVIASIDGYFMAARAAPGYAALRDAARASPELRSFEKANTAQFEQKLAIGLRGLGVTLDDRSLDALCVVIIESVNRVIDVCLSDPEIEWPLILEQLKQMICGLLEFHLPTEGRPGR